MSCSSDFWDALAPHHSAVENSYLDLPSLHRFQHELREPVLVVGAGQGLIVAAIQRQGLRCEGVDSSAEMIRYAQLRRGLKLIHASASALPFENGAYKTIIYATGVIDFMGSEEEIKGILKEGSRILEHPGNIFVAFYRFSPATEKFIIRLGLLRNSVLGFRELLTTYRFTPFQAISWIARRSNVRYSGAMMLMLRSWALSSWSEKRSTLHLQKVFRKQQDADALIDSAPENQPYRSKVEIKKLFARLDTPIRQLESYDSCYLVRI